MADAGDIQVPFGNTQLPAVPNSNVQVPANPQVQQLANTKAKANLKQKNRKKNEFIVRLAGLYLNFESATTGQLLGFTPDANNDSYVLGTVELTIKTSGSTTELTFYPALLF